MICLSDHGHFLDDQCVESWKAGVQPDLLYAPTDTIANCCANPSEMFRKDRTKEAHMANQIQSPYEKTRPCFPA